MRGPDYVVDLLCSLSTQDRSQTVGVLAGGIREAPLALVLGGARLAREDRVPSLLLFHGVRLASVSYERGSLP